MTSDISSEAKRWDLLSRSAALCAEDARRLARSLALAQRDEDGSWHLSSETVRDARCAANSAVILEAVTRELVNLITEVNQADTATGTATVADLLDLFLERARSMGRSPTTLREYRRLNERVLRPELGAIKLSKLTARDLDRLYAKLTAKGNQAVTVRHVHASISAALHQAERWDLVRRDVSRQASPPTVFRPEMTGLRAEEVRRVIVAAEAIEPVLANMLRLAALTGARRGELCALRWSDLDCKARTILVARSLYDTLGAGWGEKDTKSHRPRRIALDEMGLEVLESHRRCAEKLAAASGMTLTSVAFIFSPLARKS